MKDKYEDKYDIPERILFMALESVLFDEEQANSLMWVISISVPNREYFQGIHVLDNHTIRKVKFLSKNSILKSYRCPKFDGDAKQALEIRVERKRNWKLGELGEVSFRMLKLGE